MRIKSICAALLAVMLAGGANLYAGVAESSALRLVRTQKGKNPDKATVTLCIDVTLLPFSEGSYHQLLLDKDHNAFEDGTLSMETPYLVENLYKPIDYSSIFEYTIPQAAACSEDGSAWLAYTPQSGPVEQSLEVEPGVYDYYVSWLLGTSVACVNGDYSRGDNYLLEAGVEYVFEVRGSASQPDSRVFTRCDYDMGIVEIVEPFYSLSNRGAAERVSVVLRNYGLRSFKGALALSYRLENGQTVSESFTPADSVAPGEEIAYTFASPLTLPQKGDYTLTVGINTSSDIHFVNDTLRRKVYWRTAARLPYEYGFEGDVWNTWAVIDGNHDAQSWRTAVDLENRENTCMEISTFKHLTDSVPEYLICLTPFSLKKGTYHMSFNEKADWSTEHGTLLCGTTTDPRAMRVLSDRGEIRNNDWEQAIVNFEIEQDGDYFFAFGVERVGNYSWRYHLDNVEIDSGLYRGIPDIELKEIIVPRSSCRMGSEDVYIKFANVGKADISKYRVTYTLNENAPVSRVYGSQFGMRQTRTLKLGSFNFGEARLHKLAVKVEAIPLEGEYSEENLDNNRDSVYIDHWVSAQLPFETGFGEEEHSRNWVSEDRHWEYSADYDYLTNQGPEPLYMRCVEMEDGETYKVNLHYMAGYEEAEWKYHETFYMLCGPTGTDISTWDTIGRIVDKYTIGLWEDAVFLFSPKQSGSYTVAAVCPSTYFTLYFRTIGISKVLDYDVKMVAFEGLSLRMPVDHLNSTMLLPVTVRNTGKNAVQSATIRIYADEQKIGETKVALPMPDSSVQVMVQATGRGNKAGWYVNYKATVSIDDHEAEDVNTDNEKEYTVYADEVLLGTDYVTEGLWEDLNFVVGSDSYTVTAAVPLYFAVRDTLNYIEAVWAGKETFMSTLYIYEFDKVNEKPVRLIYTESFRKAPGAGPQRIEVPSMLLDPGYYLVCFDVEGLMITVDRVDGGYFYEMLDGKLYKTGFYGNAAFRAVFSRGGTPLAKDASVVSVLSPVEDGVFTVNEPIRVLVSNLGYEDADIPVKARVNGVDLETVSVNIPAYGKREAVLHADMSAPETAYKMEVWCDLKGDENPENDKVVAGVNSEKLLDPYVMDFEHCKDFSIDRFNPVWQTVDRDTASVYGFNYYFPNRFVPMAFMAFNYVEYTYKDENLRAHTGNKFGASFSAIEAQSDDWLISPYMLLPEEEAYMRFYVKALDPDFAKEYYSVLVSEKEDWGDDWDSFKEVADGQARAGAWQGVNVDLKDYAGKRVHLAIRRKAYDQYLFMLDDITVSKPEDLDNADLAKARFSVYPNPARQTLHIVSEGAVMRQVCIYNMSGRQVYASSGSLNTTSFRYNVSDLASGLYVARILCGGGVKVVKFMVE